MKKVFFTLAWLFAIGIIVQVLFAGVALFYETSYWNAHRRFAELIAVIPLLMLIAAFAARFPKAVLVQTGALIGMIVLIALIAMYASDIGFLSGLHPVIALFLFFRTMAVIRTVSV